MEGEQERKSPRGSPGGALWREVLVSGRSFFFFFFAFGGLPGCAYRPGEIEGQLKRVATTAAILVPDDEGVGAQYRCGDAAEGAGSRREGRLEVLKADAEESPAAGLTGPPIGQHTALVGELLQPQLEDAGGGSALLHGDREKEGGERSGSAGAGAQARSAAGRGGEGAGRYLRPQYRQQQQRPVKGAPGCRRHSSGCPLPSGALTWLLRDVALQHVRLPAEFLKS